MIKEIKGDVKVDFGYSYILWIQGLEERDKAFVSSAKNLKFPSYGELHIRNLKRFSPKETVDLKMFLEKTAPTHLSLFSLNSKSPQVNLLPYLNSLDSMMKSARYKISM